MNIKKRAFNRFKEDLFFQWDILLSMLEPIFWFYLVIPVLLFGTFFIIDLWQNPTIYWPNSYPLSGIIIILLLLSSTGNFRTFLFEADLVYLIHQKTAMAQFRICGLLISVGKTIIQITLALALLLPILLNIYQHSPQEIMMLATVMLAYKLVVMSSRKLVESQFIRWFLAGIAFLGAFLIITKLPTILTICIGILLIVALLIFHLTAAQNNQRFYQEIETDFMDRYKYFRLRMFFSVFDENAPVKVEAIPKKQKKKPSFLYRNSRRIFKVRTQENSLLEFSLKAFFRSREDLSIFFRMLIIPNFIITLYPANWFKLIIYLFTIFSIRNYMTEVYEKITEHAFFQVVPVDEKVVQSTRKRFLNWVSLSVIILMGISWLLLL